MAGHRSAFDPHTLVLLSCRAFYVTGQVSRAEGRTQPLRSAEAPTGTGESPVIWVAS